MAVNFGRLGTIRLNGNSRVVVTTEYTNVITPVGGFQPGDFDFELVNGPNTTGYTNLVTFTKSGTLCISGDVINVGDTSFTGTAELNGGNLSNLVKWYDTESDALLYKQTEVVTSIFDTRINPVFLSGYRRFAVIDININDTLRLSISTDGDPQLDYSVLLTFKNSTFSGTTIDTLSSTILSTCYLTTATVQYKGLSDNGPELTAMRLLREHYIGNTYYENLVIEYYQNSPAIINGINNSVDPNADYEFIYQSVLKVKSFVDLGLWVEAGNEYMNTYLILKHKYIN